MKRRAQFKVMEQALEALLHDLSILPGDIMGPSDATMRDVIGTAKTNARVLADQLDAAYAGNSESFIAFPSPSDVIVKSVEA